MFENLKGLFNEGSEEDEENSSDGHLPDLSDLRGAKTREEAIKILEKKYGKENVRDKGSGIEVSIATNHLAGSSGDARGIVMAVTEAITESLEYIGTEANVTRACNDCNGNPIKVGGYLYLPDGSKKKVLSLGYKFVYLSRTDDFNESDGAWFEAVIKAKDWEYKDA